MPTTISIKLIKSRKNLIFMESCFYPCNWNAFRSDVSGVPECPITSCPPKNKNYFYHIDFSKLFRHLKEYFSNPLSNKSTKGCNNNVRKIFLRCIWKIIMSHPHAFPQKIKIIFHGYTFKMSRNIHYIFVAFL